MRTVLNRERDVANRTRARLCRLCPQTTDLPRARLLGVVRPAPLRPALDDAGYRCVATSSVGFVQQLAVSYISNGYFYYVLGEVPESKDPAAVDEKLIQRYGIDVSKWTRCRRKKLGTARIQYLRHGRDFVLVATDGDHQFFVDEAPVICDVRREPLKIFGYSIGHRGGHVHVRIQHEEFKRLKATLLDRALHRDVRVLAGDFTNLPFEPYDPVRRQLLKLLRAVNRRRRHAGLVLVPVEALRMLRRIVRPFAGPKLARSAARRIASQSAGTISSGG